MKTRQQKLAEERAGRAPSPPQVLDDKPRRLRRTRAKTPGANRTVPTGGPVVPASQSATHENPQTLVQVWVDSARAVDDPSQQFTIPSALVPELLAFINTISDQGKQDPIATSSSSSAQVTPSLDRRQPSASGPPTSRVEPNLPETSPAMAHQPATQPTPTYFVSPVQEIHGPMTPHVQSPHLVSPLQEISRPMVPQPACAHTESPFQANSPQMATHASSTRIEQRFQNISGPMAPQALSAIVKNSPEEHSRPMASQAASARFEQPFHNISRPMASLPTYTHVQLPLQETYRPTAPHDSPPTCIEPPFQQTPAPVQSSHIGQPIPSMPQNATPTHAMPQAVTPSHSDILDKQTLDEGIPDQKSRNSDQPHQTEPARSTRSSLKSQSASGSTSRKRRASSCEPLAPPSIKRKLEPVPSDPKTIHALGIPGMFRNKQHLPTYTADGSALYGSVAPSNDYLKFQQFDEASANEGSTNMDDLVIPETPQASRSILGRKIQHTRSVKARFGISPLSTISERSESTPPTEPIKNKSAPAIRFPSRYLDSMNNNKRKRWTSPDTIHNPTAASYGLGEAESYGNVEDDKEEDDTAGHQQPRKVRRTSQSVAENSNRSRARTGQQSITNTPILITNLAGKFKVPSPGDSDWSDSQSDDGEVSAKAAAVAQTNNSDPEPTSSRPQFAANAYEEWLKTASPAVAAAVQGMDVSPIAAGHTFENALANNPEPISRPQFTAYQEWLQTASPAVTFALGQVDVDPDIAGAAFKWGLDNISPP